MKRIALLAVVFAGLAAFVYFYEIRSAERREEARRLEESLLSADQEDISAVEIVRPDRESIRLEEEGDRWVLVSPLRAVADQSSVDGLLRDLASAKKDRALEPPAGLETFGLGHPRLTLLVSTLSGERRLQIGADDFTGNRVYVREEEGDEVFLTSDRILTAANREPDAFRSRKVLFFARDQIREVEIETPGQTVRLARRDGNWHLEAPIPEKADQGAVSGLLSSLEFGEVEDFVVEQAEDLSVYGLHSPALAVRLRQEGEEGWRTLEVGSPRGEAFFARNPDRPPVFAVSAELRDKLVKDVWEYRDKGVLDAPQSEISRLEIERGREKIVLGRENFKWTIEQPEEHRGKEALSYKFWYPLNDLEFETIRDDPGDFPEPDVRLIVTTQDGSSRRYEFARQGNRFLARRVDSNRQGTVSQEGFETLFFKVEEIIE